MSTSFKDSAGNDIYISGTVILNNATNPGPIPFSDVGYASTGFLIMCTALVFFMTPGLGLFYSGLSRTKNALSLLMTSMMAVSLISIQWMLFGFSLAFSETGGSFIGNFAYGGMKGLGASALELTAPQVPGILFALYQGQFSIITAAIIFGSVAERIRLIPAMVFIFLWSTLVYDPVAYWTWSYGGWLKALGGLDFAGGGPVHIASGFAGLAYCLMVGKRHSGGEEHFKAHNMTNVFLGTAILWFGWLGFNGGSAVAATPRAAMAALVTTLAAASGSLSWVFYDYLRHNKLTGMGYCAGAIAGLVGITPGSGYVSPWAAIVIGAVTGVVCNVACRLKNSFGFDDSLDAFGVHGLGGLCGDFLTGIFAQKWIAALDGSSIPGGCIDGHCIQIGYQLAGSVSIAAYSFTISCLLLYIINKIPGLHLRPSAHEEMLGNDLGEMGEVAYDIIVAPASHSTITTATKTSHREKPTAEQIITIEPQQPMVA